MIAIWFCLGWVIISAVLLVWNARRSDTWVQENGSLTKDKPEPLDLDRLGW